VIKNLTPNHLLLIALAALLLLLAAFSFYLLQDPTAAIPFAPPPATSSPTSPPPTFTSTSLLTTLTPTRRTSYTPQAAFRTPSPYTPAQFSPQPVLTGSPTSRADVTPSTTQTIPTPPPSASQPAINGSPTATASATATLSQGEYGVTGRILQNGTPMPGVIVEFADDTAPRQASTNPSGDYWFITFAPGTDYTLTFYQADNPRLTPASEVASLARLEGTLTDGGDIIELPDMEISINVSGDLFELLSPDDQAPVSAAAISGVNPLQFSWSSYDQTGTYHVELGPVNSDTPIWTSTQQSSDKLNLMWNGTLDNGSHVAQGTYWWRVAVTQSLGNDVLVVYTQPFQLIFNP